MYSPAITPQSDAIAEVRATIHCPSVTYYGVGSDKLRMLSVPDDPLALLTNSEVTSPEPNGLTVGAPVYSTITFATVTTVSTGAPELLV